MKFRNSSKLTDEILCKSGDIWQSFNVLFIFNQAGIAILNLIRRQL